MPTSLDVERYVPGPFYQGRSLVLMERWTAARAVALSPDGALLAFAGGENWVSRAQRAHRAAVVLVEAATGREVRRLLGHSDVVRSLAFSRDGARLCSAAEGHDSAVKLWDVASGECVATRAFKPPSPRVRHARLLPDGRALTAGVGGLALYDRRLRPASALARDGHDAGLLAVSDDGRLAVTASGGAVHDSGDRRPPPEGEVVSWDLAAGAAVASRAIDPPVALALSPDGSRAAVVHAPGAPPAAEAWRAASEQHFNSGMFPPVERYLDPRFAKRVSVFENPSLAPLWSLDLGPHAQAVAFSPDGAELALVGRRDGALTLRRVRASDGGALSERAHPDPARHDVADVASCAGALAAASYYRVALFADPWGALTA